MVEQDESAPALVERVLAATTRAVPARAHGSRRWHERLRTSTAWRRVAALVVASFILLPALAWYVLRTADSGERAQAALEPSGAAGHVDDTTTAAVSPSAADAGVREDVAPPADATPVEPELAVRRAEAAVLRATCLGTLAVGEAPSEELAHLLWARARQLHGDDFDVETSRMTVDAYAGERQSALALELLLDQWALTEQRPALVDAHTAALLERQRNLEISLLALERAERYGALTERRVRALRSRESALRGVEGALVRGLGAPLDAPWRAALAAALDEHPVDPQGVINAWIVGCK